MSYSYKLLSHENKLLINHLRNVATICRKRVELSEVNFDIPKDCLVEIAGIIGVAHDLGKGTLYFQEYLKQNIMGHSVKKDMELKSHGFLSSIFAFALVKEYLNNKACKEGELTFYLPYIASFVVKHHHGNLADYEDETIFMPRIEKVIRTQFQSLLLEEIIMIIYELLNMRFDKEAFKDLLYQAYQCVVFDDIESMEAIDGIGEHKDIQYYILQKYLFSVLIYADKRDVILGTEVNYKEIIQDNIIDIFLEDKKKNDILNRARQKAYIEVTEMAANVSAERRIYSISLPTGLGKTFTSVSFALKLSKRLSDDKLPYKIIYCLPFTSIIDQNFTVLEDVYQTVIGKKPDTSIMLKHHYLSDVFYKGKQDYDIEKSRHLIDSWESSMIITTFVQFFHTLFGNVNNPLIKFSAMQNTIVILDEIQSIPYKYWLLLNLVLSEIANRLNMYFILVTATQPLIFNEEKDEIKELVTRREEYFSLFNRTTIFPRLNQPMHIEDFCDDMLEMIQQNPDKDILIVLNTIKSAKQVFNYIQESDLDEHKNELIFLSTAVIPKHRRDRILSINKNTKKRKIVVSTQLIEAGVDIDMDIVVKDIGPWDSIIQAAGRANRHNQNKLGHVYVYILKDDKCEFYRYIYKDDFLTIQKTLELLKDREKIHEIEYGDLTREYFKMIHYEGDGSADTSYTLLKYIWEMRLETVNREFQLIDKLPNKVDVFVEVDDQAKQIWNKFQELKEITSPFEKKRKFAEIKSQFYQYVISVDSREIEMDDCGWIGYISMEQLPNMYNIITGYGPIDEDTII